MCVCVYIYIYIYIYIVQCSSYDEDKKESKYFKTAGKTFRAHINLETGKTTTHEKYSKHDMEWTENSE